jgi:hypothetical protein
MFPDLMNSIKNNSTNSNYAQHILEMNHMHGTIENTVDVLHITGKEGTSTLLRNSTSVTSLNKTNI